MKEGKRGVYKGGGDELWWFIMNVDYRRVKEGSMRETKHIGLQCWRRFASFLSAFRHMKKNLVKKKVLMRRMSNDRCNI